jgi:hypothetical protein
MIYDFFLWFFFNDHLEIILFLGFYLAISWLNMN